MRRAIIKNERICMAEDKIQDVLDKRKDEWACVGHGNVITVFDASDDKEQGWFFKLEEYEKVAEHIAAAKEGDDFLKHLQHYGQEELRQEFEKAMEKAWGTDD